MSSSIPISTSSTTSSVNIRSRQNTPSVRPIMTSVPSSMRLNVMTSQIPDLKNNDFGVSSPSSPQNEGYTCAFPSWPNRQCLDSSRQSSASSSGSRSGLPDREFLASLREQARPDSCFEDDSEDEDDFLDDSSPFSSSSSSLKSNITTPDSSVKQTTSLLTRALSQQNVRQQLRAVPLSRNPSTRSN